MAKTAYRPQELNLSGLSGISDRTLEMHLELYRGYVKNTNLLLEQLTEMSQKGRAGAVNPAYAELTRRLGFEYGGMVLHEYYFGNLAPKGRGEPSAPLRHTFEQSFGGFDAWKTDFAAVGSLRGVGWAVLYEDPTNRELSNHWIALHQQGVPSGFTPLLVMDVWEHAYLLDYMPAERGKYIEAFFAGSSGFRVGGPYILWGLARSPCLVSPCRRGWLPRGRRARVFRSNRGRGRLRPPLQLLRWPAPEHADDPIATSWGYPRKSRMNLFANVDWITVNARLASPTADRLVRRAA